MSAARLGVLANEHSKQVAAGPKACWLWACGLMYASRGRDGFIPEAVLPTLYPLKSPKRLAARLVSVALWERAPGGYHVHDFVAPPERQRWSTAEYQAVFERDGRQCRYCRSVDDLTVDHVIPRCQGGPDLATNLVVACRSCNGRKGGRTPEQAGVVLQ